MFLSNPGKYFLFIAIFALFLQACGSAPDNENKAVVVPVETKGEFPFSTKEPEIYQGDLVVTGGVESRWFVARKGEKSRFDTFAGNTLTYSQIKSDKVYYIDHQKKTYAIMNELTGSPSGFDAIAANFFRGKEYRQFEDLGINGKLHKFKVKESSPEKGEITIYIDETSGMMIKQEFGGNPSVVFEIRDLTFEVDDSIFAIPDGYRKVAKS